MEGKKKMKKKFKNWIFSIFKEQIQAAHLQSFGLQLPNGNITIGKEEYRFQKITCSQLVNNDDSRRSQYKIFEAGLHAKHGLSKDIYERAQIKTRTSNESNSIIVEASLYIGIRVK